MVGDLWVDELSAAMAEDGVRLQGELFSLADGGLTGWLSGYPGGHQDFLISRGKRFVL